MPAKGLRAGCSTVLVRRKALVDMFTTACLCLAAALALCHLGLELPDLLGGAAELLAAVAHCTDLMLRLRSM